MSKKTFTTREASEIFIQPNGPNTKPEFLGTRVDADDLNEDRGALKELIQCFDGEGSWETHGETYNPPKEIMIKLSTYIGEKLDRLEKLMDGPECQKPVYFHLRCGGRAGTFNNWLRSFVVRAKRIVTAGLMGLASRTEDKTADQTFELVAIPPLVRHGPLVVKRVSTTETAALNDLAFNTNAKCANDCGPALKAGDQGMVVADAVALSTANTLYTSNGATFAVGAADPFAADENISSVVVVQTGPNSVRFIVARGTTDAGAPAEIAYSDDNGTSWTLVNVGSTNGQFMPSHECLFAIDQFNIWAVTTGGYIYKSEDAGASWTAQDAGVTTTNNLNCVKFINDTLGYAAGASNTFLITQNGGLIWSLLTGPAAQAGVAVNTIEGPSDSRIFAGYANGKTFYSEDNGATWAERSHPGSGIGQVRSMHFWNELTGVMARNNASPVGTLLFTEDGGYTWIALTTPANSGLNAVQMVNPHLIWAVGEPNGATPTAVILKAFAE